MQKASNNDLTLIRKLKLRKHREKEKLFFVEGERAVIQLVRNGLVEVEQIFLEESLIPLFEAYPSYKPKLKLLDRDSKEDVYSTETPQGILAICRMPDELGLDDILNQSGLIVAFDRIQDPGNAGTMMRTAAWFGVSAMLISKGSVDMYNPKVARSTAGATGSIPIFSGELSDMLLKAEEKDWKVLLLDGGNNSVSIQEIEVSEKQILVIGNEANGVDKSLFSQSRNAVRIDGDKQEQVESLNAAIALGIGLFKLMKA